ADANNASFRNNTPGVVILSLSHCSALSNAAVLPTYDQCLCKTTTLWYIGNKNVGADTVSKMDCQYCTGASHTSTPIITARKIIVNNLGSLSPRLYQNESTFDSMTTGKAIKRIKNIISFVVVLLVVASPPL